MTAKEFATTLIEESGYQFKACIAGISEVNFTAKPLGDIMSIKEALEHQTEACIASSKAITGEKHDWGAYRFPDGTIEELIGIFDSERTKAVALAMEHFEDHSQCAKDYIIAHEFYHVGQMCAIRQALKDGFEPYSIYRF